MNSLRDVIAGLVTMLLTVVFLTLSVKSLINAAQWVINPGGSLWPVCHTTGLWAVSAVLLVAWAAALAR